MRLRFLRRHYYGSLKGKTGDAMFIFGICRIHSIAAHSTVFKSDCGLSQDWQTYDMYLEPCRHCIFGDSWGTKNS